MTPSLPIPAEKHAALADIAREIQSRWSDATQSLVDCGRLLAEAKELLDHGDFTSMVDELLPFSNRTAQRLMSIASNPWIANATHCVVLPPSWGTLYELSRLDPETLEKAAADGLLRPDMARADAVCLRRGPAPAHRAEAGPLPATGRYGVILADPPWPFDTWSARGKDRSPENHYPTMTLDDIAALPVADLAADDCALFMWCLWSHMPDARGVLDAWGFRYSTTAFVWAKPSIGLGYWTRQQTEPCLIAVRGHPKRINADVAQLIEAPRGRHSEKPDEVFARIERLVAGPYIELFARSRRPGWDAWGNEAGPPSD
jgi:N6-adenosine-specific RNA methylase IME4